MNFRYSGEETQKIYDIYYVSTSRIDDVFLAVYFS